MIHLHIVIKFRAFGRDITRHKEEFSFDTEVPLPVKNWLNWSRFGVSITLATS